MNASGWSQSRVFSKGLRIAGIAGALVLGGAASAGMAASSLGMLDALAPGFWELRERGAGPTSLPSTCIDAGRKLIQLRHQGLACASVVIDDTANELTVQYTCRGQGYGRTHIRKETNALLQIDSQGIANGLPFAFAVEARRVSHCAP